MVRYSHLFKNFPEFVVIHTVKDLAQPNKQILKKKKNNRDITYLVSVCLCGCCGGVSLVLEVETRPRYEGSRGGAGGGS